MRVLLIGGSGQLGKDILDILMKKHQFWAPSRASIDVTMPQDKIMGEVLSFRPNVIINCAAMHDLEKCEENPGEAFNINALGQMKVAKAAKAVDATMIFISTNCVFDGTTRADETTAPNPISVYGASKLSGEHFTQMFCAKPYIIRTSGLFGKHAPSGKPNGNFVDVVMRKLQAGEEFNAKTFENINPTYTDALAALIVNGFVDPAANKPKKRAGYGVYHLVGAHTVNWYEYSLIIAGLAGLDMNKIKPVMNYTGDKPNIRPRVGAIGSIFFSNKALDLSLCLRMYLNEKYGIGEKV